MADRETDQIGQQDFTIKAEGTVTPPPENEKDE